MSADIIERIRENVLQGRVTAEDEGMDEGMAGQPGVTELIHTALGQNIPVADIINNGLTASMQEVGKKYENEEYYIPDMLASAEAVGAAMEILEPRMEGSGVISKGTVLFATVKDDLHDIGKNIVAILLRGAGYTVTDIGNDIPSEVIVEAVRTQNPDILALSALLTSTMGGMEETIQLLETAGLRESVKVLIGGAPITREYANRIGADGYGADGFHTLTVVDGILNGNQPGPH
jgi:5-methyltetrahydrofolate--homocysteine methyltransferase